MDINAPTLVKKVQEELETCIEHLSRGSVKDFNEYEYTTGKIFAYRRIIETIEDMVDKRIKQEEM